MLEKALELFERLVIAIEKIAENTTPVEHTGIVAPAVKGEPEGNSEKDKEIVDSTKEEKSEKQKAKEYRESLKTQLDDLGVDYSPKASNKTLENKLKKAQEEAAKADEGSAEPVEKNDPVVEESEKELDDILEDDDDLFGLGDDEPEETYTKEEVMEFLKEYVDEKGKEQARKKLQDIGAGKLSDIKEEDYGKFVRSLKE